MGLGVQGSVGHCLGGTGQARGQELPTEPPWLPGHSSLSQLLIPELAFAPAGPTEGISLLPPPQALPACAGPALDSGKVLSVSAGQNPLPRCPRDVTWLGKPHHSCRQESSREAVAVQGCCSHIVLTAGARPDTSTPLVGKKLGLKSHISQANKPLPEKKGTACGLKPWFSLGDFKLMMCPILS